MTFNIDNYRKLINHEQISGRKIRKYLNDYNKISDIIQYLPDKFKRTYELYKNKYYNNKYEKYTPYDTNIVNYINKFLVNKIENENIFREMSKNNEILDDINDFKENNELINKNNNYDNSVFEEPEIDIN